MDVLCGWVCPHITIRLNTLILNFHNWRNIWTISASGIFLTYGLDELLLTVVFIRQKRTKTSTTFIYLTKKVLLTKLNHSKIHIFSYQEKWKIVPELNNRYMWAVLPKINSGTY